MKAATEIIQTPPSQRRWLASLWRQSPKAMGWAFLAPVLSGLFFVVQAYFLAHVLDALISQRQPLQTQWVAIVGIALLIIVRALFLWSGDRLASRAVEHIKQTLRHRLFFIMLSKGPTWTRQHPSGTLASAIIEQVEALDGYLRQFLPTMYAAGLLPIIFVLIILPTDWVVAVLFLVTAPLIPVFMAFIGWGAEAVNRKHQAILSQLSGVFGDRIKGLFTLTLFGRTQQQVQTIRIANDELNRATMGVLRIAFISSAVLELFAALGVAGVAVYIGFSYLGSFGPSFSQISLQHGLFCLLIAPEVYQPLRQLAAGYHERATAKAAVAYLEDLLVQLPALGSLDDTITQPVENEAWQFKNIGRAQVQIIWLPKNHAIQAPAPLLQIKNGQIHTPQGQALLLDQINLNLFGGQHVALMGPSGSGKTSFLETLIGLRFPTEGKWLHFRRSVKPLEDSQANRIEKWQPQLGVISGTALISQQPFLTMGTVKELLSLAATKVSDEQLWQALEQAYAADFVRQLPQGLNTVLGTRGFGLSGGQAHRLALARLFLLDPQLVLLDEPTAYLDPKTRNAVIRNIIQFCQHRSLIIATHDPAIAQMVDHCWVIEEGQIKETQ